ncbi:MAG: helix-turn-helix domain-containing protein [Chelatococcus sp.]|nr:helix-turn-helix domain-containing protein [Chelatococcus sp.]
MKQDELIRAAIAIRGSESKLAVACGVSQAAIWKAKRAGRVSPRLAAAIHRATNGSIPKWRLCPDVFDAPGAELGVSA